LNINARLAKVFNDPEFQRIQEEEEEEKKRNWHPCDKNIPKWRLVYEYTGQLGVKFKGVESLKIKLDDVRKTKMKFLNREKTVINVKESRNDRIIKCKSKKIK